jgi:hypothetical protein
MGRVNPEQFAKQRDQMLKEQRTADAAWANETYKKLGGDKKAYDFTPSYEGESYENQRYGSKPVK